MISVCMATYNGAKYLKEQIASILCQLGTSDELIISDDGSKDGSLNVVDSFKDERIKVFHHGDDHGFTNNFENALMHAKGDYIFLSDQDDIWKDGKVSKVMTSLKTYDIVIHDAELIDGNGNSLGKSYYSTMHHHTGFLMNLWKTRWLGCCMAFRRCVLDYCLPIPSHVVAHDYWIGMVGMLKFNYCFMDDVLISYRRHGGNVSPSSEKSPNSFFYKVFTKRAVLLGCLIGRCFTKHKL